MIEGEKGTKRKSNHALLLVLQILLALLRHIRTKGFREALQTIRRRALLAKVVEARRASATERNHPDRVYADDGYRRD